jgi:hypothetical protein
MKFIFLHVGLDIRPYFLVQSIRKFFPSATIIQCSDLITEEVKGVDQVFRYNGDINNLMTFRLESFANLDLQTSGIYLDTDMLVVRKFETNLLKNYDGLLCRRTFGNDDLINHNFMGMNLSEYKGKTFGEIYPFLACFTATSSSKIWKDAAKILQSLDKKFHFWYGDQEALRILSQSIKFKLSEVDESSFACLPDRADEKSQPFVLHFKGKKRKADMLEEAKKMGLV